MVSSDLFETTCPHCQHVFDVPGDAPEGDCPRCRTHLLFLEPQAQTAPIDEGPLAPPPIPEPPEEPSAPPELVVTDAAPLPKPPKGRKGRAKKEKPPPEPGPAFESEEVTLEPVPEALEPAPLPPLPEPAPAEVPEPETGLAPVPLPALGELTVRCPACTTTFGVAPDVGSGTCPGCRAELYYETQYPTSEPDYDVTCPSCGQLQRVPLTVHEGACSYCTAALVFEDVYADGPSPSPVEAPSPPAAAPGLVVSEPEPEPSPEPTLPVAQPPHVAPTGSPHVPMAQPAPSVGLPYTIDCPNCKNAFGVPPAEREGACPHCNTPLAFVTEKEYQELLQAEDLRKQLQARHHERLQRRRQREQPTKAEKPPEPTRPVEPGRLRALFRRKTKPDDAVAVEPGEAVLAPPTETTITVGPAPTPEALPGKSRRKKTSPPAEPPAPAAVEPPPPPVAVVESEFEITAAPTPEPEAATAKKGLFRRFRKAAPAEPDAPAAAVEAAIEIGGTETPAEEPSSPLPTKARRGKKAQQPPPPAAETAPVEVSFDAPATIEEAQFEVATGPAALPAARAKKSWFKRKAAGATEPMPSASPPSEVAIDDVSVEISAAPPEAAPPPKKKSFFGRSRSKETAPVADAVVEGVDVEVTASPAPEDPMARLLRARQDVGEGEAAHVEIDSVAFAESPPAPVAPSGSKRRKRGKEPPTEAAATVDETTIEFGQ